MGATNSDSVGCAGWKGYLCNVVNAACKCAAVTAADKDGDAFCCQVAQAAIDRSQLTTTEAIFSGTIAHAECLHFMIDGNAIENINESLGKRGVMSIGLIVEDSGLRCQSCDQFNI